MQRDLKAMLPIAIYILGDVVARKNTWPQQFSDSGCGNGLSSCQLVAAAPGDVSFIMLPTPLEP